MKLLFQPREVTRRDTLLVAIAQTGADLAMLYERGFSSLQKQMLAGGTTMRLQVVWGDLDGLVPKQGREYLHHLLVTKLGMVDEQDWIEIEGVGHDEVMGLEYVADTILSAARRALVP